MDLKQLCEINAPSGDERALRRALLEEAQSLCGEENVRIDRLGNVVCTLEGTQPEKPHVCVSAHMDEVGFIISGATEEGLLRFKPIGGIDARVIVSKHVVVGEDLLPGVIGAMAIHLQSATDRAHVLDFDHLFIDIGAKDKDEALSKCPLGTYAYFDTPYLPFGDGFVCAKALDDRVGCFNLLRLMKNTYPGKVTLVFASREEVGCLGSIGAGFSVQPDIVLNLEGTAANDLGDVPAPLRVCCAGKGVAVSFMDNSSIAQKSLFRKVLDTAKENGIAFQIKTGVTGSNDAGSYQRAACGCLTTVLSVPCRYIHSGASVCKLSDVDAQYELVNAFLMNV